jgi:hypothetical protein
MSGEKYIRRMINRIAGALYLKPEMLLGLTLGIFTAT